MKLRGIVKSDAGAPLGKAEVSMSLGHHGVPPMSYVTTTGPDGRFEFDVGLGQYFVRAERAGYVPAMLAGPLTLAPDRPVADLEFTMVPQAVITGRVLDADGEPFEGVGVMLLPSGGPAHGRQHQTNDEGEFRISGIAPGRYFLRANMDFRGRGMHGRAVRQGPETAYPDVYYPDVQRPRRSAVHRRRTRG